MPFYLIVGAVIVVALAVIYFFAIRPRMIAPVVEPTPVPDTGPEATPEVVEIKEPIEPTEVVEPTGPEATPPDKATPAKPTPPVKETPALTAPEKPTPGSASITGPVAEPTNGETLEPVVIKSDLTTEDISRVISARKGRISYCFTRGLEENPAMSGVSLIQFTIEPDGSVSGASVASSSLESSTADECLRRRVLRLRFPPFTGSSKTVKFPFKYTQ
jgi:outer membrane biosynthesis protein TonB